MMMYLFCVFCSFYIIKKLHELNIPIEQIAKVVELKEEEVKEILNDKKA